MFIGGVMEHIEQAGVHSGDSACSLPPYSLSQETIDELKRQTGAMAKALNVVGLMNVQFAIQQVSKTTAEAGRDLRARSESARLAHGAVRVEGDRACRWPRSRRAAWSARRSPTKASRRKSMPPYFSVKEAVFPFVKFPGVDPSSDRKCDRPAK